MSDAVDDRPVNLKALAGLPPGEPVVMINLLRFIPDDGYDSYLRYGREVGPHLERVGGRLLYSGIRRSTCTGPPPCGRAI